MEPSILWSGLALEATVPPAFTDDANLAFAPHLYAESITMDRSLGLPALVSIERGFELARRAAERLDVPLWSGEYGYWGDDRVDRLRRYAAAEDDALITGSAYWVWKQACGDPQNGVQEYGDGLVPQLCSTGAFEAPNAEILALLTRAYPRRTPGRLVDLESDGQSMTLRGTDGSGCGLEVWVPGSNPQISAESIANLAVTPLGTGQLISGCTAGTFTLRTGPAA